MKNTLRLGTCNEGHAIATGGMKNNSTVDTECTSFKRMVDAHVALIIVQQVSLFNETHNEAKEAIHLSNGIKTLHGRSKIFLLNCLECFMTSSEPFSEEKTHGGAGKRGKTDKNSKLNFLNSLFSLLFIRDNRPRKVKPRNLKNIHATINFAITGL